MECIELLHENGVFLFFTYHANMTHKEVDIVDLIQTEI